MRKADKEIRPLRKIDDSFQKIIGRVGRQLAFQIMFQRFALHVFRLVELRSHDGVGFIFNPQTR